MEIISSASVLAAVIGVTQVLKMAGLPTRVAPIASIAIGIAFSMFFLKGATEVSIFAGIVMGLSASGLWSSTKSLLGK